MTIPTEQIREALRDLRTVAEKLESLGMDTIASVVFRALDTEREWNPGFFGDPDKCPTCGRSLFWDAGERILYCMNDYEPRLTFP